MTKEAAVSSDAVSAGVEVKPPEGSIKAETKIEAQILTVQALLSVCEDIADRAAEALPANASIILGLSTDTAAWAGHRRLVAAFTAVAHAFRGSAPVPAARMARVTELLTTAAGILAFFRADYETKAVDVSLAGGDFAAVLGGQLVRRGLQVLGDRHVHDSSPLLVAAADAEAARREALAATNDEATRAALVPLSTLLDSLGKIAAGTEEPELAAAIARGEVLAEAARRDAYLIQVRPLASGGGLEMRTHLWRNLFLGPAVRYAGGVAAAYHLEHLRSGAVIDAGVSYDLKGPRDFTVVIGEARRSTSRGRPAAFTTARVLSQVPGPAASAARSRSAAAARAPLHFEAIRAVTLSATRAAIAEKRDNAPFDLDWDLGNGGYGFADRSDVFELVKLIFEFANGALGTDVAIPPHFPSEDLAGKTLRSLMVAIRDTFVAALGV